MFLQETKTKRGGKTYVSFLIRESYRTANGPRGRTICNVTHLPKEVRDMVAQALRGAALVPLAQIEVNNIHSFGGCVVLEDAAHRHGLEALLAPLQPRNAALVQAMVFGGMLFAPSAAPFAVDSRAARLAMFCGLDWERERFDPADLAMALRELDERWPQISALLTRPPHNEVRAITLFRTGQSRESVEMGALGLDAEGIPAPLKADSSPGAGLQGFLEEMAHQSKSGPPLLALDEETAARIRASQLQKQPWLIEMAPQSLASLLRQLNTAQLVDALRGGGPVEVRHHGERYILTPELHQADFQETAMKMGSIKELGPLTATGRPTDAIIPGRSGQPALPASIAFHGLTTNVPAERLPAATAIEWNQRAHAGRAAFSPVHVYYGPGEGAGTWRNHQNLQFLTHRLRCHIHGEWRARGESRPVEEVLRDLQEVHRATLTVDGVVVRRLATHPSKAVAALLTKLRLWELFEPTENGRK